MKPRTPLDARDLTLSQALAVLGLKKTNSNLLARYDLKVANNNHIVAENLAAGELWSFLRNNGWIKK